MKRAQTTALIAAAMLSTSLQPGAWFGLSAPSEPLASHFAAAPSPDSNAADLPAVSAAPRLQVPPEPSPSAPDELILAMLFERLSNRHTALSDRERLRVAETILAEARAHDLEPELVIAVIEVESAGYPMAVSHVGARGLMQLMPATGEEVAHKHGIPWRGHDTLFDPVANVQLGTAYLRQLVDHYRNVTVALAAYNWGPGAIDRRIANGQTVPVLYIEQVMSAYDRGPTWLASNTL